MDIITLIKTLFIGCLGAGGYYIVASFVYHYFPMPFLNKNRSLLKAWGGKKYRNEEDITERKTTNWVDIVWIIGTGLLIGFIILSWFVTFGIYLYGLHRALTLYIAPTDFFWVYYGIAIIFPSIWVVVRTIRFIKPVPEPDYFEEEDNSKPLLEQIIGD